MEANSFSLRGESRNAGNAGNAGFKGIHPKLKFDFEALSFDDVLLVPAASKVVPAEVSTDTLLTKGIKLSVPLISAPMDTVTEGKLAISMAREGGVGVIHRNMPVEKQAAEVATVKKSESYIVRDPLVLSPKDTVEKARLLLKEKGVSSFLIVENDRLVGIVTNRDLWFCEGSGKLIEDVMTRNVATAPPNVGLEEVKKILYEHRVEKLPLVDREGKVAGLITAVDIEKSEMYPKACRDEDGKLRVCAAVGPGDFARAEAVLKAGADAIVVDTAHGHSQHVIETVRELKHRHGSGVQVVAGNVVTPEATEALVEAGADAVKVGVGPGSICTTRIITGVGIPQVTAVALCSDAAAAYDIPVIADGGIRYSGDVAKAIAAGAHCVMIGSLFAGCEESPGKIVFFGGRKHKQYRGMGSLSAMAEGGSSRYFQDSRMSKLNKLVPEGVEGIVPYVGFVSEVVFQLVGGLKSAMGYCGCQTVWEFRSNARFVKVSGASVAESHPHDVTITNEAPNYTPPERKTPDKEK